MLRFAQHDSSRVVCFTYLRNEPLVLPASRSVSHHPLANH